MESDVLNEDKPFSVWDSNYFEINPKLYRKKCVGGERNEKKAVRI